MAVIKDGIAATHVIDYEQESFRAIEKVPALALARTGELSASMCSVATAARPSALFDPAYYEELIARPFREGTISESPRSSRLRPLHARRDGRLVKRTRACSADRPVLRPVVLHRMPGMRAGMPGRWPSPTRSTRSPTFSSPGNRRRGPD